MSDEGKVKRTFKEGEPLLDAVTAEWLNSVEERLARFNQFFFGEDFDVINSPFGFAVALNRSSLIQIEFCRSTADLGPYCTGKANVLSLEAFIEGLASSSSCDDIPLVENTDLQIDIVEITGVTTLKGTNGIAIKFKRSADSLWAFIHWPLSQGDNLPNYKFGTEQALVHAESGYLQWMDIALCSSSSSSGL